MQVLPSIDKMPKLWSINQFIVFSLYLYSGMKKKKVVEAFFFKLLMLDYGRCNGFLRPYQK